MADRKSWLLFCCGVRHAYHVRDALCARGVAAGTVTADTPSGEREAIITAFRRGDIRALTNVNVLTTGFDVPQVDLIAMLRPTLSTGLYVQIVAAARARPMASATAWCWILPAMSCATARWIVPTAQPAMAPVPASRPTPWRPNAALSVAS